MSDRHHYTQFFGRQRKEMLTFHGILYEAVKTVTDDNGVEIFLCRADNRCWKKVADFPETCVFPVSEQELTC